MACYGDFYWLIMGLKENGIVKFLRKRFRSSTKFPQWIHRADHCLSRKNISQQALKVLYRLSDAHYDAYLVGGSVRDLLLNRNPKDFDIATNATPEDVRKLFRNSRIIGRRFRLVHVYFEKEVVEVSTFRANSEAEEPQTKETRGPHKTALMITADNTYGTIEEDAWRRDFTVNALYYNIKDFSVVDFTGGLADLKAKKISMIGDPLQRFHEDPIRLLRAIRLAAKLDFSIDDSISQLLTPMAYLLEHVPQARLLDEMIKLFFEGYAVITFQRLQDINYVAVLFPELANVLAKPNAEATKKLVYSALKTTDQRFYNEQRLTPGFLLAVLLWPVLQNFLVECQQQGMRFSAAFHLTMQKTVQTQAEVCLLTKRMLAMMRAVWTLQYHLERRRSRRIYHLLKHRYFRAAFDLLALRAEAGEVSLSLVQWWDTFQNAKVKQRHAMLEQLEKKT
ncbi:MAG: hypothetical protein A3F41_04070 [Coxiella sp. RIFCSPHIGHO2_12_FULL_44_14]|nr:MAG: hypothetical protein A3F41_04070 [Coxiella sp. RIFCSPHIGHO2_12_FULL_44_14]